MDMDCPANVNKIFATLPENVIFFAKPSGVFGAP